MKSINCPDNEAIYNPWSENRIPLARKKTIENEPILRNATPQANGIYIIAVRAIALCSKIIQKKLQTNDSYAGEDYIPPPYERSP